MVTATQLQEAIADLTLEECQEVMNFVLTLQNSRNQ